MTAVMLLGAGLGTRLRPLSEWCAKPMLPVGDRALLAHVFARAQAAGGPFVVNAHHRAEDVRELAASVQMAVSEEARELLGTAGGVAHAAEALGPGDVLIWNGDILADVDVRALLGAQAAAARQEAVVATLAVAPLPLGEGNVGVDERGRVVRLRRETVAPGEERGGAFLGVHVLGAALREALPARGCLVGDVYLPALRRGARLATFAVASGFVDIGTPAGYLDANLAWLGARDGWVAPGASVAAGVRVVRSVVGRGARVTGAGALARCVVWPGAEARAPLSDAVITPRGVVSR